MLFKRAAATIKAFALLEDPSTDGPFREVGYPFRSPGSLSGQVIRPVGR
jgi:hypothetical protein